jgi:hypothetical protein
MNFTVGGPLFDTAEKRHRRDLDRIQRGFSQSVALGDEAKTLERRAARAETNDAISSDDPDALKKLRFKLETKEKDRMRMAAANKVVRSEGAREALRELSFSPGMIGRLLTPDPMGRIGFPPYAMQNAANEVARLKKRIEALEARAMRPAPSPLTLAGDMRVEEADNRVRVVFPGKPDEAIRTKLKSAGFRWAPSVGAWQRQASNAAWGEARRIVGAA